MVSARRADRSTETGVQEQPWLPGTVVTQRATSPYANLGPVSHLRCLVWTSWVGLNQNFRCERCSGPRSAPEDLKLAKKDAVSVTIRLNHRLQGENSFLDALDESQDTRQPAE